MAHASITLIGPVEVRQSFGPVRDTTHPDVVINVGGLTAFMSVDEAATLGRRLLRQAAIARQTRFDDPVIDDPVIDAPAIQKGNRDIHDPQMQAEAAQAVLRG